MDVLGRDALRILDHKCPLIVCADQDQADLVSGLVGGRGAASAQFRQVRRAIIGDHLVSMGFPFFNHGQAHMTHIADGAKAGNDRHIESVFKIAILNIINRHDPARLTGVNLSSEDNAEFLAREFENAADNYLGAHGERKLTILFNAQNLCAPLSGGLEIVSLKSCDSVHIVRAMLRTILWLQSYKDRGLLAKMFVVNEQLKDLDSLGRRATTFVDSSKLLACAHFMPGANRL